MKTVALMTMLVVSSLSAQTPRYGAGVVVGEPTGFSTKIWFGKTVAADAAMAWSFLPRDIIHIHTTLLFHHYDFLAPSSGSMPVFYGAGVTFRASEEIIFGIRAPVGVSYLFESLPVELFAELAPRLDLVPHAALGLNGALGVRYLFR